MWELAADEPVTGRLELKPASSLTHFGLAPATGNGRDGTRMVRSCGERGEAALAFAILMLCAETRL